MYVPIAAQGTFVAMMLPMRAIHPLRIPLLTALMLVLAPLLVMMFALGAVCVDGCPTEVRVHAAKGTAGPANPVSADLVKVTGLPSRTLARPGSPRTPMITHRATPLAPLRL
jgi:hypothetical protein